MRVCDVIRPRKYAFIVKGQNQGMKNNSFLSKIKKTSFLRKTDTTRRHSRMNENIESNQSCPNTF